MIKLLRKLKNSKRGFSLVELIVVIAIMAVIAAVLVPSLLMHVEESRAEKDIKTTDEVVTAVELALADQDVYDELVEHSVFDNVSCYVDKDSESGYEKTVIKETYNGNAEQYMFGDDARQNDEVPYYGAGNMRGLTITFSPEKDSNESTYELSRGIINRFVGRKTGYLYENEKLYNAIRSVVGDKIYNSSQTYRNSDFTIFIRLGSAGGNEAGNQDATQVWGQYNGTNLPADTVQTAKITTDRAIGDAGQYDAAVNEYLNDEKNTDIDFSQLAQMGNSNFGSTLPPKAGLYDENDNLIASWDKLVNDYGLNIETDYTSSTYSKSGSMYYVLKNNSTLSTAKKVIIDNNVTSIGDRAFMNCTKLTSIAMPNNIISIGSSAFYGCKGLTSIVIPDSVTSIDESAFENCRSLTSVDLGSDLIGIEKKAFYYCDSLVSIVIPEKVKNIGDDAFHWCKSLTSIIIDDNNTIYDSRNNCNAIIKTATNTLLQGCKSTIIPRTVTSIGSKSFKNQDLTSIIIPDSVTSIGDSAFYGCNNLTSVTIGSGVKTINDSAFADCSLKSINIPNSVTSIKSYAFRNCDFTSIIIPSSVSSIGENAFAGCIGLTSVYFKHTTAPGFGNKCFYIYNATITFYFKNDTVRNAFTTSYYNSTYGTKSTNYDW